MRGFVNGIKRWQVCKLRLDPLSLEVSKIIKTLPEKELDLIKWMKGVDRDEAYADIQSIAKDILLGEQNSLAA